MNTLAGYKIREIRDMLKTKKISPVEIFRIYRRQAENVNYTLNALVADRFEDAFNEAQALEKKIMNQPDLPIPRLAGLPFTCKEMIEAEGMPFTVGLLNRKGIVGKNTASVVKQLQSQGGIFIGVTNVPELGFWFETDNLVYGRTNNPYDLKRTPGGSSGGEGALIATGASAFGVGSDVGGSIRIPAMFCGLFGHKPTKRTIPFTGHFPMSVENAPLYQGKGYRMTTMGPMARNAEDLIELFQIMNFQDGIDNEVQLQKYSWDDITWKGRKVYTLKAPEFKWAMSADKELQTAVKRAAQYFEDHGAQVEELPSDLLKDAVSMWYEELSRVEGDTFNQVVGQGKEPELLKEWTNLIFRKPQHTLPILVNATMEKLIPKFKLQLIQEKVEKQRHIMNELLGDRNILLLPTHPRPAFFHHSGKLRPYDFIYTGVFNALDLPATQVPMGLTHQRLPIGIQVVAQQYRDDLTLLAAKDLEKAFGGWQPIM